MNWSNYYTKAKSASCPNDLQEVAHKLTKTTTNSEVGNLLEDLTLWAGLDSFSYIDIHPAKGVQEIQSWDKGWLKRYKEKGYGPRDPVVIYSVRAVSPFRWSDLPKDPSVEQRQIMDEAAEFHVRDGFVIPVSKRDENDIPHYGYLSFQASQSSHIDEALQHWRYYTGFLARSVMNAFERSWQTSAHPSGLTIRQRECILWAARGKTINETAIIMNISSETVKNHLNAASDRLDTVNKTHTVAKALKLNLIHM